MKRIPDLSVSSVSSVSKSLLTPLICIIFLFEHTRKVYIGVCVQNTMGRNQEIRKAMIKKIAHTLKEIKESGKELDMNKFISILGAEEGISRRTAKEYILSAEYINENSNNNND